VRLEFPDFRDSLAALPPGRLSLDDARLPQFCIYEDPRLIAYYAPFDYVNTRARLVLVGVTPGPTQMLESYAIVRDAMRADRTDEDALRSVKAHASFKGMRKDLAPQRARSARSTFRPRGLSSSARSGALTSPPRHRPHLTQLR
jgi:hypothetical protein